MSAGNRIGFFLGMYAPWLIRWLMNGYAASFHKDPERFVDAIANQMAQPDRELLQTQQGRNALLRDFREAYRQGSCGHMIDSQLVMLSRSWGFKLKDISTPVFLWYGEADTLVSKNMTEYLVHELPRCKAHFVRDAGHLLLDHPQVIDQVQAIMQQDFEQ